jgi:UMF1 family MFS transporter
MSEAAPEIGTKEYRRRKLAWAMYDWANSAYITTTIAAVGPIFYSDVAAVAAPGGARLLAPNVATAYWGYTATITLLIVAILSPILGAITDITHSKKRFLAIFAGLGIVAASLMVFISYGDWLLASLLLIIGRVGFGGSIVFADSLLPHVAKTEDEQNKLSTQGYALGYLGGGLLLALNIAWILMPELFGLDALPGDMPSRLAFLSVGIWWLVFSIPIFRQVPEPRAVTIESETRAPIAASFSRLRETFGEIRQYDDLFKFLVGFWVYNDGIGTIITMATIYGTELGLGASGLVTALLITQFVGVPFSFIFGSIPSKAAKNRSFFLAYIVWNLLTMPALSISSRYLNLEAMGEQFGLPVLVFAFLLIIGLQIIGLLLSWLVGRSLFHTMAENMTTKRAIILSLIVYAAIAVGGFLLESEVEFWVLAWTVGVVQGGSQALSRSLFATMVPPSKSGEFFGFFSVMEKFSAIIGPFVFSTVGLLVGSSRPGILILVLFFVIGIYVLTRVNEKEGQRVAQEEEAALRAMAAEA